MADGKLAAKRKSAASRTSGRRKDAQNTPDIPAGKENRTPTARPKPTPAYKSKVVEVEDVSSQDEDTGVQEQEFNAAETLVGLARRPAQTQNAGQQQGPTIRLPPAALKRAVDKALGISEEEGRQLDEEQSEQAGEWFFRNPASFRDLTCRCH